jgi:hypothetical protein
MAIDPDVVIGFDEQDYLDWDNSSGSFVTGAYGVGFALQGPSNQVKTLSANYTTAFIAFHYFTQTLGAQTIFGFRDAGTAQTDLRIDGSGGLFFTRNGTTLGSVSTLKLSANTLYSLVLKIVIDGSAGVAECKVGGTSFLALSSQNTKNSSNAFFNQILITSGSGLNPYFDNMVLWDTTSGTGNDLTGYPTGELVVDTAGVAGAGANNDFTPSTGSNYQNVDEAIQNGDTDYNSSVTVNNVDTFAVANLHATSGTVIAIVPTTVDRIDDATPHTLSHRVKSSSATVDSTAFSSTGTYKRHKTKVTIDPNTSAAPTVSGRNAMNVGYKLAS